MSCDAGRGRLPPACPRCRLAMVWRKHTHAIGRRPPVEVESAVWWCPLCGSEEARPVRVRDLGAGKDGAA